MLIDLLRHGEYEGDKVYCGMTDRKLTGHGWQQMSATCENYKGWQQIISSPLSRCMAFAMQLAERLQISLRIDHRWEEMYFGDWDGRTTLDIMQTQEQLLADFWANPLQHSPPGGETLQQVNARVLQAWDELKQQNKPTLVVTHGGPMRIIYCHQANHPLERLMEIQVHYAEMHAYSFIEENTR